MARSLILIGLGFQFNTMYLINHEDIAERQIRGRHFPLQLLLFSRLLRYASNRQLIRLRYLFEASYSYLIGLHMQGTPNAYSESFVHNNTLYNVSVIFHRHNTDFM